MNIYFFVVHGELAGSVKCIFLLLQKRNQHWSIRRWLVFVGPILIAFELKSKIKICNVYEIWSCLAIYP